LGRQAPFVKEGLALGEMNAVQLPAGRLRYRRFVEEGLLREVFNPLAAAQWQTLLGSESFVQAVRDRMQPDREKRREV
jgi:hypothetical protein